MGFNINEHCEKDLCEREAAKSVTLAQSASRRNGKCSRGSRMRGRIDLHWLRSARCCRCSFEQREVLDDSCESAALQQILSSISEKELVDPVMTVLDDAVAEHLRHRLEALFGLLACLSQ